MKILLTTHQFFPEYTSGTEVLTYNVARELKALGHTVNVFTGHPSEVELTDGGRLKEYDYEDIHVYQFNHSYQPMAGQNSLVEIGYDNRLGATFFDEILDAYQPDLVHFFHLNRIGTRLINVAVKRKIPCYFTPTDFWCVCATGQLLLEDGAVCSGPSCNSGNCIKHLAQRRMSPLFSSVLSLIPSKFFDLLASVVRKLSLRPESKLIEIKALSLRLDNNITRLNKVTKIISPNSAMTNKLLEYGISPTKIATSAFGVEVPIQTIPIVSKSERQKLVIGFIGTIAPYKGCHVLVDAVNMISSKDFTLKIYGRESDFPDYAAKLRHSAQNNVEFCGVFENSKMYEVLDGIDILVVPSLWVENTPLVIYSAQAAGCPVIASDFPGMSEVVINNENGFLFAPGDTTELAEKLLVLINDRTALNNMRSAPVSVKSTKQYVSELLVIWDMEKVTTK